MWSRLRNYRDKGPEAAEPLASLPLDVFTRVVSESVTPELSARGWAPEGSTSRWFRGTLSSSVAGALEFVPMKGGDLAVRWGLLLSYVPEFKGAKSGFGGQGKVARQLDLSYDPLDYERDLSPWGLSRFSLEAELRLEAAALAHRASLEAERFVEAWSRNLESLVKGFEEKRDRKYLRFGFYHYPQEVLAFAFVCVLEGKRSEALELLEEAFKRGQAGATQQQRLRKQLQNVAASEAEAIS